MKAVFLDRDGTITVGTPTIERVDTPDKAKLLPNTIKVCYSLIMAMTEDHITLVKSTARDKRAVCIK